MKVSHLARQRRTLPNQRNEQPKNSVPLRYYLPVLLILLLQAPLAEAVSMKDFHIHGYLDLEYKQSNKDIHAGFSEESPNLKNGSFDQRHLNILMDFKVWPKLFVKTHVEFEHGVNPSSGDSGIVLEYAFVEYTHNNAIQLRGGKMLSPWGIYNEIRDATPTYLSVGIPELLYRAEEHGGFAFIPKWTTGLATLGAIIVDSSHNDLEYTVYLGNGESRLTTNESRHDDNQNKAIGARVNFTTHDGVYHVGVSGFYGDKAIDNDSLSERHFSFTTHAVYTRGDFILSGEYGYSELSKWKSKAWFLQLSRRIGKFTPYLRYSTLDPLDSVSDDDWTRYIAGLNVKIMDFLFFKAEWNQNMRGENNTSIVGDDDPDYGEFRAAIAVLF